MEQESRRKGPRSPSVDSEDSSHRRRSRKYDRSPSPRRSRYRRSRSRDRRSGSRDRRRKETSRTQDWKQQQAAPPSQTQAPPANSSTTGYVSTVHNQYQASLPPNTSQPPPPITAYNQGYSNYNYNYSQGYDYTYQQPTTGYRSDYPPPNWQSGQVPYNNQQAPPPPTMPQQDTGRNVDPGSAGLSVTASRPEDATKEAIAAEVKQQKATLDKQREEYVTKSTTLQRELEILRQQCDEIGKEGGRENNRIVKENQKLQIEIQNKMKTIHNVIDMLTGIIGDKATVEDLRSKFKVDQSLKRPKSPKEEFPKGKSESPAKSSISDNDKEAKVERDKKHHGETKPVYNFVHYDPEMHWCKVCDIFPKTAKEYLNHLHTNEHKETCLERKIVDMPWHERNGEGTEKEVPYYPGLPTKRTPIKGLQFFSAATSWYCKLCDTWIGDLHCASLHLKSKRHSENFSRFVDQNPHWETDWMADREKAFSDERHKQMQLELQKQKEDEPLPPPPTKSKRSKKSKKNKKKSRKRKNKSSGSDSTSDSDNTESDSDQDMSRSIRVAMRNKMKASTQAILNEEIDYHGIKLKGNWAQVTHVKTSATPEMPPPENDDRQLLNSIRDKLKAKQEEEMKNSSNNRRQSMDKMTVPPPPSPPVAKDENKLNSNKKSSESHEAWGPKEPPKSFWIKKDEEKSQTPSTPTSKYPEVPKTEEIPKPHMGFWTKQQVNMAVKPPENKPAEREDEAQQQQQRERDRGDRYKDERDRKYDRRDDKYDRSDRYDNRRRGGSGRDRDRERDDYYDDRRKSRYSNDSPRRDRNWRESPKRSYDKYSNKDNRREDNNSSNDESKFEKKTNESATKLKKGNSQTKKPPPPATKGKLPFIGRLPLFKKKTEEPKMSDKADIEPLPYLQSKFEDTPKVPSEIINPPGVVHITKLATPLNLNNSIPAKVIPAPMKILVAPPPPMLRNDVKLSTQPVAITALTTQQVVDMEIEDQSEETIIEQPIVEHDKRDAEPIPAKLPSLPSHPPSAMTRPPPSFSVAPAVQQPTQINQPIFTPNRPPPFIPTAAPPFVPAGAPQYPARPPNQPHVPYVVATTHDGTSLAAAAASYAQAHGNPSSQVATIIDPVAPDISEIPEPAEKRPDPSIPLPDDLQEALNIIFPKEPTPETKITSQNVQPDTSVMYASMYSMLGCVGYGPEYMDHPPPEITQADTEIEAQPGPDDLRMLGIDEGDTIF